MTDAKLVALGKRINAALDRVEDERGTVKDLYAEAKSHGYIPKILRKAITRMRMDASKRQEEDSILDLYDHALGNVGAALEAIEGGATWEEAGKAHGVPRATLARAAAVSKRREVIPTNETVDASTGEITPNAPAERPGDETEIKDGHEGQDARGQSGDEDRGHAFGGDDPEHVVLSGRPAGDHEGAQGSVEGPGQGKPAPEGGVGTGTNSTEGEDDVATGQSESAHASDRVGVPVLARSESGGGGECSGEGCGLRAEEHETAEIESQEAPIASGPQDLSTAEPEVAVAAPPATDPEEDDLAFPDFLDVRKRRAEQVPA